MQLQDDFGMSVALKEAKLGRDEGGIPIGSALIHNTGSSPHTGEPILLGSGHNQRIQEQSSILHGEMSALEAAGRLNPEIYRNSTMVSQGAILLYRIPRVVIGENSNFKGEEDLLRRRGVEVVVVDNAECKELMKTFIEKHPEEWNEDIGEIP